RPCCLPFLHESPTAELHSLSLHDALPICAMLAAVGRFSARHRWSILAVWMVLLGGAFSASRAWGGSFTNDLTLSGSDSQAAYDKIGRATSELQSRENLVCRLLLEKKTQLV